MGYTDVPHMLPNPKKIAGKVAFCCSLFLFLVTAFLHLLYFFVIYYSLPTSWNMILYHHICIIILYHHIWRQYGSYTLLNSLKKVNLSEDV